MDQERERKGKEQQMDPPQSPNRSRKLRLVAMVHFKPHNLTDGEVVLEGQFCLQINLLCEPLKYFCSD